MAVDEGENKLADAELATERVGKISDDIIDCIKKYLHSNQCSLQTYLGCS